MHGADNTPVSYSIRSSSFVWLPPFDRRHTLMFWPKLPTARIIRNSQCLVSPVWMQVSHMRCIREEADFTASQTDADAGYIALPAGISSLDVSEFLADKGVPTSAVQLVGVLTGLHVGTAMQELQVRHNVVYHRCYLLLVLRGWWLMLSVKHRSRSCDSRSCSQTPTALAMAAVVSLGS